MKQKKEKYAKFNMACMVLQRDKYLQNELKKHKKKLEKEKHIVEQLKKYINFLKQNETNRKSSN